MYQAGQPEPEKQPTAMAEMAGYELLRILGATSGFDTRYDEASLGRALLLLQVMSDHL